MTYEDFTITPNLEYRPGSKRIDITNLSKEEILAGYRSGAIIPANDGKIWTEDEHKILANMYFSGVCISDMAIYFQRKERSISQQLDVLDLVTTHEAARCSRPKVAHCRCDKCLMFNCNRNPNYRPATGTEGS